MSRRGSSSTSSSGSSETRGAETTSPCSQSACSPWRPGRWSCGSRAGRVRSISCATRSACGCSVRRSRRRSPRDRARNLGGVCERDRAPAGTDNGIVRRTNRARRIVICDHRRGLGRLADRDGTPRPRSWTSAHPFLHVLGRYRANRPGTLVRLEKELAGDDVRVAQKIQMSNTNDDDQCQESLRRRTCAHLLRVGQLTSLVPRARAGRNATRAGRSVAPSAGADRRSALARTTRAGFGHGVARVLRLGDAQPSTAEAAAPRARTRVVIACPEGDIARHVSKTSARYGGPATSSWISATSEWSPRRRSRCSSAPRQHPRSHNGRMFVVCSVPAWQTSSI